MEGQNISVINDKIVSIHKDEFISFETSETDKLIGRIEVLVASERPNESSDDEDSADSGTEEDNFEQSCGGSDGLYRLKSLSTSVSVYPNYFYRNLCVMQSYIIIKSNTGGMYSVCHSCYLFHALRQPYGKHTHVNSHYKRTMLCCENELRCQVCNANLFQIISPEVCVVCNKGQIVSIDNHTIPKALCE